ELARALLQDAGDAEEVFGTLARTDRGPALGVRLARGLHRAIDVRLPRLGDLGERLLPRGIDRRIALVRKRFDELTTDEEAVALLEMDDLARFRCGRVFPAGRDRRGRGTMRDLALVFSQP